MGGAASCHLAQCFRPGGGGGGGDEAPQMDEALGHSFCYIHSPPRGSLDSSTAEESTAFHSISGASVSANSSATVPLHLDANVDAAAAAAFQSSSSFSALPLQLSSSSCAASNSLDRGFFLSGPIERGAHSGLLDPPSVPFSGPIPTNGRRKRGKSFSAGLKRAALFRRSLSDRNRPMVVPLRPPAAGHRVQWAHGKAGEDRAHVVVSEDRRWLFVGIYDGFNGPDASDFLLSNLYGHVREQLRGIFWKEAGDEQTEDDDDEEKTEPKVARRLWEFLAEKDDSDELDFSISGRFMVSRIKQGLESWRKDGSGRIWLPKWRYNGEDMPKRKRKKKVGPISDHGLVLGALSRALETTESTYLGMTDSSIGCNPELALMGSCLLVVLMRDEDVYVMNVGDSRAIVASWKENNVVMSTDSVDAQEGTACRQMDLEALQLSTDHSTNIEEEVLRIMEEHPDDDRCIINGRVKGRLNVTRAFGAGFLKQPKWNNALLEMFRSEYIGTTPYISCTPSLCHHRLGAHDQFLVLSSDGLYQYLSNKEAVLHVQNFMECFPDGDPAQSLIEELLFRAAKKAGMDFHELLDISQGDRRKYHDDVTVLVISLEGRIWKSSG